MITSAFLVIVTVVAVILSPVLSVPFACTKRTAQDIVDPKVIWGTVCAAAGGGAECSIIAKDAFDAPLFSAADPCTQQDIADGMIDLAKDLNNDSAIIEFAQLFVQQPHYKPTSQSVLYCQFPPENAELNGLFPCQFQSADSMTFVGNLSVGELGTIPFGMHEPFQPAGSCPAHPNGPIADGAYLDANNPDSPSSDSSTASTPTPTAAPSPPASAANGSLSTNPSKDWSVYGYSILGSVALSTLAELIRRWFPSRARKSRRGTSSAARTSSRAADDQVDVGISLADMHEDDDSIVSSSGSYQQDGGQDTLVVRMR